MKKKLLFGIGILLLIGGLIYGALPSGFTDADIPKIIKKNPNAQDYLFIDSIVSTPTKIGKDIKYMTELTFTTEWNSLGAEFNNNISDFNTQRELLKAGLEKELDKQKLLSAIDNKVDEVGTKDVTLPFTIYSDPVTPINGATMHEYYVGTSGYRTKNLNAINFSNDSNIISNMDVTTETSGQDYDYIFVIEATHITDVSTGSYSQSIRNQLAAFAQKFIDNDPNFQGTIIEYGVGQGYLPGFQGSIDEKGTLSPGGNADTGYEVNKSGSPSPLIYMDKTSSNRLFIKKYKNWLNKTQIKTAFAEFGNDVQPGATYNIDGSGANGPRALYEAITFANSTTNPKATGVSATRPARKKAIILVGQEHWHFGSEQLAKFGGSYDKFASWLKTNLKDDTVIMGSLTLGEDDLSKFNYTPNLPHYKIFDSKDGNASDPRPNIDRLGQHVTNARPGTAPNQFFPPNLKYILGNKFIEYQGSTMTDGGIENFQIYLGTNLEHFAGSGVIRQKWKIKFESPIKNPDVWKKLIFSVGKIPLSTGTEAQGTNFVNPTTRLMKPKTTEVIDESFADRYYQIKDFPVITFKNPDETKSPIRWTKEKTGWELIFDFNYYKDPSKKINNISELIVNASIGNSIISLPVDKSIIKDNNVSIPVEESIINNIRTAMSSQLLPDGSLPPITFKVKGNADGAPTEGSITATADLIGPKVNGLIIENLTARNILKDQLKLTSVISEASINALTSADNNGTLYIRKEKYTNDKISIKFSLFDENFKLGTDGKPDEKGYELAVKTSLENDFTGVVISKAKYNESSKSIEFEISGNPKNGKNFTPTLKGVEDAYKNPCLDNVFNTKIELLSDPTTINITEITDKASGYYTDSSNPATATEVSIDFIQTKKGTTTPNSSYSFEINDTQLTDSGNQIVALLTPTIQDKTKANGSPSDYFDVKSGTLQIKSYLGAVSYPDTIGGRITAFSSAEQFLANLTEEAGKSYDGLYSVGIVMPVNRAGGISKVGTTTFDMLSSNALDNSTVKDLLKTQYVVDTVIPTHKALVKTAVSFIPYILNTNFKIGTVATKKEIDSTISTKDNHKYDDYGIFEGTGKPFKTGDTIAIVSEDFGLGLYEKYTNTSKPFNKKISELILVGTGSIPFTVTDSAGNVSSGLQITLVEPKVHGYAYNETSETKKLTTVKEGDKFFTKVFSPYKQMQENDEVEAIAFGEGVPLVEKSNTTPDLKDILKTSKYYNINTFMFDKAGWVASNNLPIVWDYDIHDTNSRTYNKAHPNDNSILPLKNKVILSRAASGSFAGKVDLREIFELSGIADISNIKIEKADSNKPTSIKNKSITLKSSPNPISAEAYFDIELSYDTSNGKKLPVNDNISFTVIDRLGNSRNFSISATVINNINIIGASKNENKIIKSKVNLNSSNKNKLNIKSSKQETKP